MEENLQEAIQKCQQGQIDRFGEVYDFYAERIYKFVYHRTFDKEVAEDLTSVIFLKAIENLNKTKGDIYFKAWLYRIARNTVIDYWRTQKNNKNIDDLWDLSGSDLENLAHDIELGEIKKFMETFSKDQRDILVMRLWDGLSFKEIADIVGKKEGSVKMQTKRGLEKIRSKFGLGAFVYLLLIIN